MKITQVNVRLLPLSDDHALAVASIVLDDAYAINGIRVIRRADGELQILYPCLPTRIHIHKRQVFAFKPINRPAHRLIERAVLEAYRKTGSTSGFVKGVDHT